MAGARAATAMWVGILMAGLSLPRGMARAASSTLVALTEDGTLITFPAERPGDATAVKVTGLSAPLVGIDRRPANGRLYGVTTAGDVYMIDPATGAATLVSTLTTPFNGGARSGVDFNPKTDRLRLVGHDGQNLRVNVDNGATAVDRTVAYGRQDAHFGEEPAIAGTAYSNNVAGAETTDMFDLDSAPGLLVRQDPPNDGILQTIGPLGVPVPPRAGFDIVTDASGKNRGLAAFDARLYDIDLTTGAATSLGTIGGPSGSIVGLTALAP